MTGVAYTNNNNLCHILNYVRLRLYCLRVLRVLRVLRLLRLLRRVLIRPPVRAIPGGTFPPVGVIILL